MSVLTQVGHIGIGVNGSNFKLVPSLANISKLDDPVADYAALHESPDRIETAYKVIEACCDGDISEHLGQVYMPPVMIGNELRPIKPYSYGTIPDDKALIIALSLLHHGIVGTQKTSKLDSDKDNYSSEFSAMHYAGLAIAHLGLSSQEAWSLTMTELRSAMEIKFPPDQTRQAQEELLEDYDDMLKWRHQLYGDQKQG